MDATRLLTYFCFAYFPMYFIVIKVTRAETESDVLRAARKLARIQKGKEKKKVSSRGQKDRSTCIIWRRR